jgi:hypothetical protein
MWGAHSWRDDRPVVYNCCWLSPAQSCLVPRPTGLMTIFYCLRFETPRTWWSRSPYLYPPGTGWPSYNPRHWVPFSLVSAVLILKPRHRPCCCFYVVWHRCSWQHREQLLPQFLYCCVPSVAPVISSHVTFTGPFPSNGRLCWFHNCSCEPSCHYIWVWVLNYDRRSVGQRDSRPYFTVSDSRLPFSSPPTTRRVTVEVFDPASTRVISKCSICSILMWPLFLYRLTFSRKVYCRNSTFAWVYNLSSNHIRRTIRSHSPSQEIHRIYRIKD